MARGRGGGAERLVSSLFYFLRVAGCSFDCNGLAGSIAPACSRDGAFATRKCNIYAMINPSRPRRCNFSSTDT